MSGKVEALWIKRAHRGVMDSTNSVTLIERKGIDTDANFGRSKRQVTVIEKEVFDRISAEFPEVEPSMRRANVMVSGVRLENTRDHILTLGEVEIHLYGETRPCERMDAQVQGLTEALDPNWNGGAYGVVLNDGEISVGDNVSITGPKPE
ncbi:MAG: MOSC domain-containing protein [Longimicrobiales bacterium]